MKPSVLTLIAAAAAAAASTAHSFSSRTLADLHRASAHSTRSTALLSDLVTGTLSAVGSEISSVLSGTESAIIATASSYTAPGAKGSSSCAADKCCIWSYVVADMRAAFTGCTSLARAAIRLGFHDAAVWSSTHSSGGGADGSVVLSDEENARSENRGLGNITAQMKTWHGQYAGYGVGMADLVQMGATTAVVSCPGGPRIRSYVGRADSSQAGPAGLLPSPLSDAATNIALFEDKTFTAADLVALVGAHTVSQQFFVDTSVAGAPQDSTDGVWDTNYYKETASSSTPAGVFKFPSDVSLASHSSTSGTWQTFANDASAWATAFANAYYRMSLLGVKNLNDLTECTSVLPTSA